MARYYTPMEWAERLRLEREIHRMVTSRSQKFTNFVQFRTYKLIYRKYAGLFFTIAVDVNDNELSYLELIHLYVECLDMYFGNVCELDIVFHFDKVYMLLDELVLAGEVCETSKRQIQEQLNAYDKIANSEKKTMLDRLLHA
eukprot:g4934.t1